MVKYELGNIADWLSAIGTIGAVVVALYLARRESNPRAFVQVDWSYEVDGVLTISREPSFIKCRIVNIGIVPIYLSECTIFIKKRKMAFVHGTHLVNKSIRPGELYEHSFSYSSVKSFCISNGVKHLNTNIYFLTPSGKKFKTKIKTRFESEEF
ncbi:hypothetical protein [Paenibacillus sp. EZ-K15]|uniref:hypothetical protein n=1 Tax=Paenibacillus sp. EZ-K15 TaxID=2044275 RepID=UPI000BF7B05A|nr:hypothetical protein [Paenibacillus sp. EZ-K15]